MTVAALAAAAYLLGSVSFAVIVGRRAGVESIGDVRISGVDYRGVSATTLGATAGTGYGLTAGLLDIFVKGFIPVLAVRLIWVDAEYHLVVALAILVGHLWPVFHRFRGGRGVAVVMGAMLAIDPLGLLAAIAAGMVIAVVVRDMVYSYVVWVYLLVPWFLWQGTGGEGVYAVASSVVFTAGLLGDYVQHFSSRGTPAYQPLSFKEFFRYHPAMGEREE